MKILLKLEFEANARFEEVELEGQDITIRSLLDSVGERSSKLADPLLKEAHPENFMVSVNGEIYQFLPDMLDAELKDGDTVEVNLVLLAGG